MELFADVLVDSVVDTIKLIPFLLLTYIAMEALEHGTAGTAERLIARADKSGPVVGAALGALPQCGFSAMAATLYAGRVISAGTLVAVILSTSDELIPVFMANRVSFGQMAAIVGTKGYTFEGPFYLNRRGQVAGWDEREAEHAEKLVERELERLRASFEAARNDGFTRFIMFLHYPPTNILERRSGFTDMAEEYGAEQVVYAHCHGQSRFHDSIEGRFHGIDYRLVSGDYLVWNPARIL